MRNRAFTLLELLVVVGIIAVLAGILLPSLSKARESGRTLTCLTHLQQFGAAWSNYSTENEEVLMPARMFEKPGGRSEPSNWYEVGNGLKYRPRWPAVLGGLLGIFAFDEPSRDSDTQDYDHKLYKCPVEPQWVDERNYAYGYNHLFLGNARQTSKIYHNFPVRRHRITAPGSTVVFADSLGTAAGFARSERGGYSNDGRAEESKGNHGYTLDPPRMTEESDRGTGGRDSSRTAVDPRHRGKVNVVFADGHGDTVTSRDLGYRTSRLGRYVDLNPDEDGTVGEGITPSFIFPPAPSVRSIPSKSLPPNFAEQNPDAPTNRLFSGCGQDSDPPDLPADIGG